MRGALLLLCATRTALAANPAIEANELGINAAKCADTYCSSKDSLALWLSIAKDCYGDSSGNDDGRRRTRRRRALTGGGGKKHNDDDDGSQEEDGSGAASLSTLTSLDSSESISWGQPSSNSTGYPRWLSGLICSLLGTLGMALGLVTGRRFRSLPRLDLSKTRPYVAPVRRGGGRSVSAGPSLSLAAWLRSALLSPFSSTPRYAPVSGYDTSGYDDERGINR